MAFYITQLNIYPVKSLGGISVSSAYADSRGFQYDRRWMIVDEDNRFITQREIQRMALVGTSITGDGFLLYLKNDPSNNMLLPFSITDGVPVQATVWNDTCKALHYKKADRWIRMALGAPCSLIYMPDTTERPVDTKYVDLNDIVSFADAYPYLIIGEESLNDLNDRLQVAVPMNRFRPSIVFGGGKAFEEDTWRDFFIGDVAFNGIKGCGRCMITTVDQETAETGKEPLRTLASYRTKNHKVLFGQNLIARSYGRINVGDELKITSYI